MQGWHEFYEMIGGAAATLLGLLFVSVSLNAETILGDAHRHSRRMAEQAFQNYITVLVTSLLVVFPGISPVSFGSAVVWIAGIWGAWSVWRMIQALMLGVPSHIRVLRRYIPSLSGLALVVYAGYRMIFTRDDETTMLAIAEMLLLVSATVVSWELLIQLAAEKFAAGKH